MPRHQRWPRTTGTLDLPDEFFRNAKPTPDLPNGVYKVVFFVRDSYGEPTINLADIELEFSVTDSMG